MSHDSHKHGAALWKTVTHMFLFAVTAYGGFVLNDIVSHDNYVEQEIAAVEATGAPAPQPAGAAAAAEQKLGLGRAATAEEVRAWDIDVRPDGKGLPEGIGSVTTGDRVFLKYCAVCHGDFAEGVDRWPVLAGGQDTLASRNPVKTIGSYWPYLSTVWDYVHRAMPFGNAQSLTNNEVYAIVAFLLYSNDIVDEDFTLSHLNFGDIRMPNEANFIDDDRMSSPLWGPRDVCMENCKDDVKITMRAAVLDVTPETEADGDTEKSIGEVMDPMPITEKTAMTEAAAKAVEVIRKAEPAAEPVQVAAAPAAAAPAAGAVDEALVAAGEKVFKKCKACHQVGDGAKNRTGPILNGVVGASVAAHEGFRYSKALKEKAEEGAVWDAVALDAFLEKPKAWAQGTKMGFAGLKKQADRAAVIEYLKTFSQ